MGQITIGKFLNFHRFLKLLNLGVQGLKLLCVDRLHLRISRNRKCSGALRLSILLLLESLGQLELRPLLDESVEVLATVIAGAHVIWIDEFHEMFFVKVLLDNHVVRLGPIFKPKFDFLKVCIGPLQLATQVLHSLVSLLGGKLSFRESEVGAQICHLHGELLVLEDKSIGSHVRLERLLGGRVRLNDLAHALLEGRGALSHEALERGLHRLILLRLLGRPVRRHGEQRAECLVDRVVGGLHGENFCETFGLGVLRKIDLF